MKGSPAKAQSPEAELFTDSGIPAPKVAGYRRRAKGLGKPGSYPFTRGIYPDMYRARLWTMRQYTGFGDAEDTNKRFKYLLQQGQTGLSVAFDLPTQLGLDSDDPRSEGEVGRVGVAITNVEDMGILFGGLPLERVSTSMTINATAPILTALYQAVAEAQGIPPSMLRGTTQNDILKEFIARNTYIYPPGPSLRLAVDLIEYCSKVMPKWHPISISGYHIREAGANAIQELAFTFSNAIAYVQACLERGMKVDQFAPRLSFFFVSRLDFFEEVAKFRAARRIWAKIMKERFGARRKESMMLRFHTQTSGETLTAQEPENNIIRVTLQALAAVLGGTQSLHTNSMDEALALPSEKAVRIALRTQQILAYESGITKSVDPLGGSYYVEYLTDELEDRVWKEIRAIDRLGGAVKAIERGYMQERIRESAYLQQLAIEKGERVIVGVNRFAEGREGEALGARIEVMKPDPASVERQLWRLREFKARRDGAKVEEALSSLLKAIEKGENAVPYILKAVKAKATLGEISQAMKEVFGEYRAPLVL